MRDFYGRVRSAQNGNQMDAPQVYQTITLTSGTTTTRYIRFSGDNDSKVAIWKETEVDRGNAGVELTREYALAKWDDRDKGTTTYVPINDCWDLE